MSVWGGVQPSVLEVAFENSATMSSSFAYLVRPLTDSALVGVANWVTAIFSAINHETFLPRKKPTILYAFRALEIELPKVMELTSTSVEYSMQECGCGSSDRNWLACQ